MAIKLPDLVLILADHQDWKIQGIQAQLDKPHHMINLKLDQQADQQVDQAFTKAESADMVLNQVSAVVLRVDINQALAQPEPDLPLESLAAVLPTNQELEVLPTKAEQVLATNPAQAAHPTNQALDTNLLLDFQLLLQLTKVQLEPQVQLKAAL